MCTNGAPLRQFVPREEVKPPTVSLVELFATMPIDAHEGREVPTFDVRGAYLHADITYDKFILLPIEGRFVDISAFMI